MGSGWEVRWLFTFEDSRNVRAGVMIDVGVIRAIPNQCPLVRRRRPCANHSEAMIFYQLNYPVAVPVGERARLDNEYPDAIRFNFGNDAVQFDDVPDSSRFKRYLGRSRCLFS